MSARKTYLLCFVLVLVLAVISFQRPKTRDTKVRLREPDIDTLVASLRSNRNDYYLYRGEPAGYHMELIRAFASFIGKPYRISVVSDTDKRWEELLDGRVHIVVSNYEDDSIRSVYKEQLMDSGPLEESSYSVWVLNRDHQTLMEAIWIWMSHYRNTKEYSRKQQTYFMAQLNLPVKAYYTSLSPYDQTIKQQAKTIGWDWRLLASLIYQESKFNPYVESYRGASGLMQITPVTAEFFNTGDISNPVENIKAGVQVLRYLQRNMKLDSVSAADSIRFVLAAYNAGHGRINDCRTFARSQGKNPNEWKDVVAVIPLMKHRVFYDSEDIRLGRFKGVETLNYVDQVMDRYENYKVLVAD